MSWPKCKNAHRLICWRLGKGKRGFYKKNGRFLKKSVRPAGAGDQRAQAPQIYREKRFFLKKKCAGECTVLKFICMFAVLSLLNQEDSEGCPNAPHEGIFLCPKARPLILRCANPVAWL